MATISEKLTSIVNQVNTNTTQLGSLQWKTIQGTWDDNKQLFVFEGSVFDVPGNNSIGFCTWYLHCSSFSTITWKPGYVIYTPTMSDGSEELFIYMFQISGISLEKIQNYKAPKPKQGDIMKLIYITFPNTLDLLIPNKEEEYGK